MVHVQTTCRTCESITDTEEDLPGVKIPNGTTLFNFKDSCDDCNTPIEDPPPLPSRSTN
jgi:hypothetical protein